jgi:hypothetical protein
MGANTAKQQAALAERIRQATASLTGEPTLAQISAARKLLTEIQDAVAVLKPKKDSEVQIELDSYSSRIKGYEKRLKEREQDARVKLEQEIAARKQLVQQATKSFNEAVLNLEKRLHWTLQEIRSLEHAKPQGGGLADVNPSVTAEGIAESLKTKRATKEEQENQLNILRTWDQDQILDWYHESQARKRIEAEQRRQEDQRTAERLANPKLQVALAQLGKALTFQVDGYAGTLLGGELADILCDPIPDNGERAALKDIKIPDSTVAPESLALERIKDAKFPDGPIRVAVEKFIHVWMESGTGFGARLRAKSPEVVVAGNEAGFNIQNPVVVEFLKVVTLAIVTDMPSDTGSRFGPKYTGEL